MNFYYEDEDQILPLLLHRVPEGHAPCQCQDCEGIHRRMQELSLAQDGLTSLVA